MEASSSRAACSAWPINLAIGKPANTTITQEALVTYLVEGRVLNLVAASFPELETIASIVAGETPAPLARASRPTVSNIGAFAPAQGGGVDARASLGVILTGLRAYIETRVKLELVPALEAALAEAPPELRTYLDEVLFASFQFATDEVFHRAARLGK